MLTLPTCAQTIVGPVPSGERRGQRVGAHPALVVDLDRRRSRRCRSPGTAAPGRSCRAARRRRGPGPAAPRQPVGLDVPAGPAQHLVRAAASPVKFAICAPVTKPTDTSGGRPSSSASQPPATSSTTAAAGATDVEAGVLVPGRGQPVRGDGRRGRAADDEAEEPAARRRHESRLGRRRPAPRSPRAGVRGPLGQRPAERRAQLLRGSRGADRRSGRPSRKVIDRSTASPRALVQSGSSMARTSGPDPSVA